MARAGGADQHAQAVPLGEDALLGGEQLAEGARDAAEAEQAELDSARLVRCGLVAEPRERRS